ncbi:hypothetical protein GGR54DRAFT_653979 [Hypoxylon sp. NC1633]|nr:hypothetical protein GGR54DRAFT_653979 [Hypoxylon sp. NC1633]
MGSKGISGKGRDYYSIPWAIANLDEAIQAVNDFVDESTLPYIDFLIDDSRRIVSTVFNEARRLAYGQNSNVVVRQTLRLWVAARFLEGGWRCAGEDMLGADKMSPSWRSKDNIALPPYIDFQFASIITEKILGPLSRDVLKSLEKLVLKNQAKNWFTIFLVVFILMHSYELILQHEVAFTTRRKYPLKYYDMKLIRGYQSGAKTLLAHFHYVNKGNIPFQPQFDWNSPINKHMADLSEDELRIVTQVSNEVSEKSGVLQKASTTDKYEEPFWFVGQVFDKSWDPRITCEHSPPLETNDET